MINTYMNAHICVPQTYTQSAAVYEKKIDSYLKILPRIP